MHLRMKPLPGPSMAQIRAQVYRRRLGWAVEVLGWAVAVLELPLLCTLVVLRWVYHQARVRPPSVTLVHQRLLKRAEILKENR